MNRVAQHIVILCLLSIVFCLSGCRPKGILHSWEMRKLMCDLHKTDAMLSYSGMGRGNEEVRAIYYSQVLERHGVTQAQFDSSLVWYTAHPQLFDKIYPRVLRDLKAEEAAFIELHKEELNLEPKNQVAESEAETQEALTRVQLDSIFWITQHGYPHMWNEIPDSLVQNFIDQLFPQIGVTSGGVVDTLETSVSVAEVPNNEERLPRRKPLGR